MSVANVLKTMEYGPAPESAAPALDWLAKHQNKFGLYIGGVWKAPKKGKSWLVGNVGLAVASGGLALGAIRVIQRPVLYLALEDGHKRLQNRFRRMLADGPIPEGIEVVTRATPAEAWRRSPSS